MLDHTETLQVGQRAPEFALEAANRHGVFKPSKFLEKNPVSFPFLLDEDRVVTKNYGLYHLIGMDALNIAHPATLVIDRARAIQYIYRGDNQHDRAPLSDVLAAVKKLG